MRKDNDNSKDLGLYCVYEVYGLNTERFMNAVKKRGVTLYDIKKYSNKRLRLAVKFTESQKFFAIAEELCYNIKKVGEKGRAKQMFCLFSSLGLIIGAIAFILIAVLANDFILDINYYGSGKIYHREVQEYLSGKGVEEYKRFSDIDLAMIEDGILADNEHLSFASCTKHGNKLLIELVLSSEKVKGLNGNVYQMHSTENGVVESVKVYRGTAVVSVGDMVREGDLLVDGYAVIKDQTIKINVLASITLAVEKTYEYKLVGDDEQENAEIFALAEVGDEDIISTQVQKIPLEGEYLYKVTVKYRRVLYAG